MDYFVLHKKLMSVNKKGSNIALKGRYCTPNEELELFSLAKRRLELRQLCKELYKNCQMCKDIGKSNETIEAGK